MLSDDYRKNLVGLHGNAKWGSSTDIPQMALEAVANYEIKTLLDFGSGKGKVSETFRQTFPELSVHSYEPALEGATLPDQTEMTFSKDVLEHVEPHMLEYVLYDLHQRTTKVQYHLIACHKAVHYLPDGRNAHLIIETPDWWQRLFRSMGFQIRAENVIGDIKHPPGRASITTTKYECLLERS